jgi:hypothetical protein
MAQPDYSSLDSTATFPDHPTSHPVHSLISRRLLRQILGAIWLADGLFQMQPYMFTNNLIGMMQPLVPGQPGPIAAVLRWLITFTTQHLILVNTVTALVQVALGVFLLTGWFVRTTLLASVLWSLIIWIGGEGLGMLLTGQASALTGAPGAVLLYGILALVAYPKQGEGHEALLRIPRHHFQWFLGSFWALAALLQLQSPWWQSQQISQTIAGNEAPGTPSGTLFDSSLAWLAGLTSNIEVPLNIAIIVIALALAVGLFVVPREYLRPVLAVSLVASLLFWWATEGFGLILTGTATDFNSGLLVALMALACWPIMRATAPEQAYSAAQGGVAPHNEPAKG